MYLLHRANFILSLSRISPANLNSPARAALFNHFPFNTSLRQYHHLTVESESVLQVCQKYGKLQRGGPHLFVPADL